MTGYAEAMAEVAAQRAVPLPKPVWRLQKTGELGKGMSVELTNVQPDAAASDVRIEPVHPNTFAFDSPNQWSGPFGLQVIIGERLSRLDITFDVHYRDANGDWQCGKAVLPKQPAKMVVL